ncbi:MAG: DUF4164 family protein [Hyphomicrobiaceae bacterium]
MAKRSQGKTAPRRKTTSAKPVKSSKKRSGSPRQGPSPLVAELEAAQSRIRDLENLHRKVGARLDAAIETIHKILGRAT